MEPNQHPHTKQMRAAKEAMYSESLNEKVIVSHFQILSVFRFSVFRYALMLIMFGGGVRSLRGDSSAWRALEHRHEVGESKVARMQRWDKHWSCSQKVEKPATTLSPE